MENTKNSKTSEKKVKYESPKFYAQNYSEGSFSAGCPSMNRGGSGSTNSACQRYCLNCERTM